MMFLMPRKEKKFLVISVNGSVKWILEVQEIQDSKY